MMQIAQSISYQKSKLDLITDPLSSGSYTIE